MTYQVRMTTRAEQDVDDVLGWFHEQGAATVAQRWLNQLLAKIATLESHPERCPWAAEAAEIGIQLRELLFGRRTGIYRILFQIQGRRVHILHIRHSARDRLKEGDL